MRPDRIAAVSAAAESRRPEPPLGWPIGAGGKAPSQARAAGILAGSRDCAAELLTGISADDPASGAQERRRICR
jgi:hypothetical protein